ncbi:type II secretion system F family protein [Vulgatibacter incomptus]|uniref:Flp pilus assembly protein TadB n=1 Tax=Vulgatibacter incomptus TaxID=1391653 RepID=A0A0K1PAT2_9BACT|nr:type II secretion system F family protein [Vulgatibacter incomptus]AKU90635.1 Flp pilus assembly protein TadB [Vulgatibacter incomptus]
MFEHVLVSLLVVASVSFFAWVAFGIIGNAIARLKQRYPIRSRSDLRDLLLFLDRRAIAVLSLCMGAISVGAGILLGGWLTATMFGVGGAAAPPLFVGIYRKRRIRSFERQLVDALQSLANGLRAGLTIPQALEQIAREATAPLGQEFALLVKELKVGVQLDDALANLASRVESDDLSLVVVSTSTARQLGGNMAEMLETIGGTIRERFRLQGKIAALTSQGKMQGWIVASLPLLLGAVMRHMRPDLVEPMLDHVFGYALVAAVVLLEAVGLFFIRKIVNVDV